MTTEARHRSFPGAARRVLCGSLVFLLVLTLVPGCQEQASSASAQDNKDGTSTSDASKKKPAKADSNKKKPRQSTKSDNILFPNKSGLGAEPEYTDIGSVGHKMKKPFSIEIHNPTSKAIEISKVDPSCGCIKLSFSNGALQPGDSRKISGHVDIGTSWGRQTKYIQVWVKGGPSAKPYISLRLPVSWAYHPGVKPPPSKKRSFLLHGVVGRETPDAHAVVTLERSKTHAGQKLEIEGLRVEGQKHSKGHVVVVQKNVSDTKLEITASVKPSHPEGRISAYVLGKIDGLPVRLTVRGDMFDGIRAEPNRFQFHRMISPERIERTVALYTVDDTEFEIKKVTVNPPHYVMEVEPRKEGGYHLIARPAEPYPDVKKNQSFGAKVFIETTHPKKPIIELRIMGIHVPESKRQ